MIRTITLKQLRYLVAVADARHFGQAASACNISQPSLSAQIQQLEEALGVKLFERTKRRVAPTLLGDAMAERARKVLADVDQIVAMAHTTARPLAGPFRLGVIPTLGPYLLPRIMPRLRRAYPDLLLYLREDLTERLLERLLRGQLDAALLALPVDRPGLIEQPLFDEPFLVAAPCGHPLAVRREVCQADLIAENLLLLEDGHCFRDQALEVCRMSGRPTEDGFAATSLETLREMVAGGIGVTLLPSLACIGRPATDDAVTVLPFAEPA
ncbi:MAG TPA: LysR substrate-binding domain-containing protein, partial [Alphaproteobacteria bacterium]|nr:LysR substrate-binding domain-containing protein [Alphaproteobacteria bacterium]